MLGWGGDVKVVSSKEGCEEGGKASCPRLQARAAVGGGGRGGDAVNDLSVGRRNVLHCAAKALIPFLYPTPIQDLLYISHLLEKELLKVNIEFEIRTRVMNATNKL